MENSFEVKQKNLPLVVEAKKWQNTPIKTSIRIPYLVKGFHKSPNASIDNWIPARFPKPPRPSENGSERLLYEMATGPHSAHRDMGVPVETVLEQEKM